MPYPNEYPADQPHPHTYPNVDHSDNYKLGYADGLADADPNPDKLNYGGNRLNDYERGYIDAGRILYPTRDTSHTSRSPRHYPYSHWNGTTR